MVACIETERGPPCAAVDRHRRRVRAPSTLVESSPSSTFHTRKHSSHLYPLLYICIYKQINSKKERFVYICIQFSSGSRPCLPSSICLEQWKKKQSETRVSHMYIYIYIYIFIYININELQLSSCSELTCFSTVWVERKSWLNQWNKRENSERDDIGRQERDPGIDGFHRQFCFHHFQHLHLCINYFRFSFLKKKYIYIYIYIRNVSWENRKIDGEGRWTD